MPSEKRGSTPSTLQAVLPLELEKEIFEYAARSNPKGMPTLIIVARRVKTWIEPLLYRVVCVSESYRMLQPGRPRITSRACLKMLALRPATFIHDHVQHLSLTSDLTSPSHAHRLAAFSGIANLALFNGNPSPQFLPIMAAMPLRRLSTELASLFPSTGIDFDHPIFSQLTHLDLLNTNVSDEWAVGLGRLPCLTHLSFNWVHGSRHPAPAFDAVLLHCSFLQVLILNVAHQNNIVDLTEEYTSFAEDPRLVLMVLEDAMSDWELGADGGADYWVRAERFVKKRESGAIKGESYCLPSTRCLLRRRTLASEYVVPGTSAKAPQPVLVQPSG
ncbi:hypothetical protein FB451DRAFT_1058754 [Mycena latifolia]|nr:hypothetical protein FB451DRAFT_1058754 [Mycena latifolia]